MRKLLAVCSVVVIIFSSLLFGLGEFKKPEKEEVEKKVINSKTESEQSNEQLIFSGPEIGVEDAQVEIEPKVQEVVEDKDESSETSILEKETEDTDEKVIDFEKDENKEYVQPEFEMPVFENYDEKAKNNGNDRIIIGANSTGMRVFIWNQTANTMDPTVLTPINDVYSVEARAEHMHIVLILCERNYNSNEVDLSKGIGNMPVDVYWNSSTSNLYTNHTITNSGMVDPPNGTTLFSIDLNQPAGIYFLNATFGGYSEGGVLMYPPSQMCVRFAIYRPTNVTITATPDIVVVGNNLNVKGNLKDNLGQYVKNVPVKLQLRHIEKGFVKTITPPEFSTDNNGNYNFIHTVNMSENASHYAVIVTFEPLPQISGITNSKIYVGCTNQTTIIIKRLIYFKFSTNNETKMAFRNKPITIFGNVLDNMNEAPRGLIDGVMQTYKVRIYWDRTYLNPTDDYIDPLAPWNEDGSTLQVRVGNPEVVTSNNSGYFEARHIPDLNHNPGKVNVTFYFENSTFYEPAWGMDVYEVWVHSMLLLTYGPNNKIFRNTTIAVTGKLYIDPTEDPQGGSGLPDKTVKLVWTDALGNITSLPDALTNSDGIFTVTVPIPRSHPLGVARLHASYGMEEKYGYFPYIKCENTTMFKVVSNTTITMENKTVFKGETVQITGIIRDDQNERPNVTLSISIHEYGVDGELGRVVTGIAGNFSYTYYVGWDKSVDNYTIIARFKGNADGDGSGWYLSSQGTCILNVMARTNITRLSVSELVRGEKFSVRGRLYEDWAGVEGAAVKAGEPVSIILGNRNLGNVPVSTEGDFLFVDMVPSDMPLGEVPLLLSYNGSAYKYSPSSNLTYVSISARTTIEFESISPNGTVTKGKTIIGYVVLRDDMGARLDNKTVSIYYSIGDSTDLVLISDNCTDSSGSVRFTWVFNDVQKVKRVIWAFFNGTTITLQNGTEVVMYHGDSTNYTFDYKIPVKTVPPDYTWVFILLFIILIALLIMWAIYEINKRRAIKNMQRIIRKAADQLVAGNAYAAVIFKAYRQLAATMKKYGYLRKDSETFREFEKAIRVALPIDTQSMDALLSVLEEARYSKHEMNENDRDRAIAALRAVQMSLQRVSLSQDQLARIQQSTKAIADEDEPEILVKDKSGLVKVDDTVLSSAPPSPVTPPVSPVPSGGPVGPAPMQQPQMPQQGMPPQQPPRYPN